VKNEKTERTSTGPGAVAFTRGKLGFRKIPPGFGIWDKGWFNLASAGTGPRGKSKKIQPGHRKGIKEEFLIIPGGDRRGGRGRSWVSFWRMLLRRKKCGKKKSEMLKKGGFTRRTEKGGNGRTLLQQFRCYPYDTEGENLHVLLRHPCERGERKTGSNLWKKREGKNL